MPKTATFFMTLPGNRQSRSNPSLIPRRLVQPTHHHGGPHGKRQDNFALL
jgi:hypothetical protein